MNVDLSFLNKEQEIYYWHRFRNGEFDGAFANGKTTVACQRAFTHLITFPNYAMSFCRQEYKRLRSTTMKTFFKVCPDRLIYKHNEQDGYTVLINKSFIYWMHLDEFDEGSAKGLEINSAVIDQAEEVQESIYNVFDSRIGRWDKAQVPDYLLEQLLREEDKEYLKKLKRDIKDQNQIVQFLHENTLWPRHKTRGFFLVPNYIDILCNIADEEEFHWTFRYYNPLSIEKKPDHFYIHRASDESMQDAKTYQQMLLRDEEYVNKYVLGIRGKSKALIHRVDNLSIINSEDYKKEEFDAFIKNLLTKGALYRILDHGETGITACGWLAIYNNLHIFYREYYVERKLISENRKTIAELSEAEEYFDNFADPQIFKKTQQSISGTAAGFWTVAMEYADTESITDCDPINWTAADNNEFATRNRINELLLLNARFKHPLTQISPAPGLYFIKKHIDLYPFGINEGIKQIKNQKRTLLGEDNGKKLYSEERDPNIVDHAYDYIRYGVAMHNINKEIPRKRAKPMTFEYYNQMLKRRPRFTHASSD